MIPPSSELFLSAQGTKVPCIGNLGKFSTGFRRPKQGKPCIGHNTILFYKSFDNLFSQFNIILPNTIWKKNQIQG